MTVLLLPREEEIILREVVGTGENAELLVLLRSHVTKHELTLSQLELSRMEKAMVRRYHDGGELQFKTALTAMIERGFDE